MSGPTRRTTRTAVAEFSFSEDVDERERALRRTSRFRAHEGDDASIAPSLTSARHRDARDSFEDGEPCPTH